jgi:homoserine O-acetyltransferase
MSVQLKGKFSVGTNPTNITGCQYFHLEEPFPLEYGDVLPSLTIAYHTFGKINARGDNVIWIVHAFTANSNPLDWWENIVGHGKIIDIDKYYVICANAIGSPYGSTNPLSIDPRTNEKYYHNFPTITPRDQVAAFEKLRKYLNIDRIKLIVGASVGGQHCLEWSIIGAGIIENQLIIASNAVQSPWATAFNETARMAIYSDPTYLVRHDKSGLKGLATARAIAMLSYRSHQGFGLTQKENDANIKDDYKASSYVRYQGLKLTKRFDCFSYLSILRCMDTHNIARGRGTIEEVLKSISVKTFIISIDSDVLFPPSEQIFLHQHIKDSTLHSISSEFGHDGFLIENDLISRIISSIINSDVSVD